MIDFQCEGCGRSFSVPETFAGRRATCKKCGRKVTVPTPAPAVEAPAHVPLRIRRLQSDAKHLAETFGDCPHIRVLGSSGDPPDRYELEYSIRGLERGGDGAPAPRELHRVEIQLTLDYPRLAPRCRMLTPIFHPNIDPAAICVGDHWTAGERLANLIVRIGEMIAYQAYNIKSPLDAEAAMWADLHSAELPIDSRNLQPAGL